MIQKSEENKCAHTHCECETEPGSKFCSPQCENNMDQTDCGCGHADCHAKA
ncbi:MAG: hypothetical protein ACR2L1_03740 [Pyrinomonadaceae bacterium]